MLGTCWPVTNMNSVSFIGKYTNKQQNNKKLFPIQYGIYKINLILCDFI